MRWIRMRVKMLREKATDALRRRMGREMEEDGM
jgi:hypothetical protein